MKGIKFYAMMMSIALCMTSVTSCSSDDDDIMENIQESGNVTSFDQVEFLQNNLVEIDSLGNVVQRVNGAPLNTADPTELFICAKDVNEAAEMFKGWLSPDTEVKLSAPSTVNMEVILKDINGTAKTKVYFRTIENGQNLAEVTFGTEGVFKYVSKVVFIKESAWPDNAELSPFSIGDTEVHPTYEEGDQKWVCIREAKKGQSGLLMYISERHGACGQAYIKHFASVSLAKEASNILRKDWDSYVAFFSGAGRTLDKSFYWINDWKYYGFGGGIYAIRLSDGKIDWFEIVWKNPDKHFIQIRTFGIVTIDSFI